MRVLRSGHTFGDGQRGLRQVLLQVQSVAPGADCVERQPAAQGVDTLTCSKPMSDPVLPPLRSIGTR